jgi:acetyl-CoA synthetase
MNYQDVYGRSMQDPEGFWAEQARQLEWFREWDRVLDWNPPFGRWFVGGELNASYLCLDRNLAAGRGDKVAIHWEGEDGTRRRLTYSDLLSEVNRVAAGLRRLGVAKGDVVVLYLPMIPEAAIFMLACARIGAIHCVVFSGFSAQALADRINNTQARFVITADGGKRRGRIIPLKSTIDTALASTPSVEKVVVVPHAGADVPMVAGRDVTLAELTQGADEGVEPEHVEATHPLFILYTSGTTGKPKGIVHSTGGYMVYNHSAFQWAFNLDESSVYWCTADVGWVTGHSAVVYGPLSQGATVLIYEGTPDYPDLGRWWQLVEDYGVTALYTSPTAIRMLMQHGDEWPAAHDLSCLRILGSVGEPINPEAWHWFHDSIGGGRCPIIDTWWQTETGSFMIAATPGIESLPLKPGAAGLPLPGIDPAVVDDAGQPMPDGEKGTLVIRRPWPGMLMTVHGDEERYRRQYWSRFPGVYNADDFAIRDSDGYFHVLGRADETLKIAGHRLGSLEIENAAVSHDAIAEAAAIGVPDPIKGEALAVFAVLMDEASPSPELRRELIQHIRSAMGAIVTPDAVYFVSSLPKTRSGKIMRRVLRAVASDQPPGDVSTLEDEASVQEATEAYERLKREL